MVVCETMLELLLWSYVKLC